MFRLSLEKDDKDAIEMKEQILESAKFLGLQPNQNISEFFESGYWWGISTNETFVNFEPIIF